MSASVDITAREDCYGALPMKYPLTWTALCHIGSSSEGIITYEPIVQSEEVEYVDYVPAAIIGNGILGKNRRAILDGYSTSSVFDR